MDYPTSHAHVSSIAGRLDTVAGEVYALLAGSAFLRLLYAEMLSIDPIRLLTVRSNITYYSDIKCEYSFNGQVIPLNYLDHISMSKSALVFGASGVTGWSFINEVLNDYPKPGIWKRAHALTNRPLSQEQSQWPKDPRLNIVSGIDLLAGSQEDVENELRTKIPDINEVTHVYYLAYKAGSDVEKELKEAVEMYKKALIAADKLCSNLEFVVLQTGAKMCMFEY